MILKNLYIKYKIMQIDKLSDILSITKLNKKEIKNITNLISDHDHIEDIVYEIVGLLENDSNYNDIIQDIKDSKFGWDSKYYSALRENREQKDHLLDNPPEIREGETECPKCGKKKTLIVEMQTRSADEGYTYYIHCFNPNCRSITK